jgi:hypothetical protein
VQEEKMRRITKAIPLDGYLVKLQFDDGLQGVADLSPLVGKGIFAKWQDPTVFKAVRIGESGELTWGDDLDLCPDALYLQVTAAEPDELFPRLRDEAVNA